MADLAEPNAWLTKIQVRHSTPEFSFSRHRLNVAIPLECECCQAELHCSSNPGLSLIVGGKLTNGVDLTASVALVFDRVNLVGLCSTGRKTVVTRELPKNFF